MGVCVGGFCCSLFGVELCYGFFVGFGFFLVEVGGFFWLLFCLGFF